MKKKPSIWVNCLVKNEERWIWYALQSVLNFVERIIVWDTGSTDKTADIINSINDKKIEFKKVGSVTKDTYSRIRQKMLEATNCDWVFIVAGDEIWPKKTLLQLIRKVKKSAFANS